ncbi:hypothetical protein GCM10009535_14760 [Streptomyces thermocarboxydovorans]|uniref:Uncharacterized protein n=1 Tax=Streptomyces thermocarboxydovorans TaxID=59298 RepID=A0ABN1HD65_9ACTN
MRAVLDAFDAGDTTRAARLQQQATPLIEAMLAKGLPGTVTAKALLTELSLPAGPVRPHSARPPPLQPPTCSPPTPRPSPHPSEPTGAGPHPPMTKARAEGIHTSRPGPH